MKCQAAFLSVRPRVRATGGFTLLEMMIVVTVIAILAAIAFPSYQVYHMRANRSAAQQIMLSIQNREEQYILDARAYSSILGSGTGGLNIAQEGWTCAAAPSTAGCSNRFYTVTVTLVTGPPPSYTINAVPTAGTYQDGSNDPLNNSDGTLRLTGTGTRTRIRAGTTVDLKW